MLFWVWLISSQWKGSCPLLSAAALTAVTSAAPFLVALCPADSRETVQGRKCGRARRCHADLLCFERRVEVELFTFLLKS